MINLDWNKIWIGIPISLIVGIIVFILRKSISKIWKKLIEIIPFKIIRKKGYQIDDTVSFNISEDLRLRYPDVFELYTINENTVWNGKFQGSQGKFVSILIHYYWKDSGVLGGINNGFKNIKILKKDLYEKG